MISIEQIIEHREKILALGQHYGYQDVRLTEVDLPNLKNTVCFITKFISAETASVVNRSLFNNDLEKLLNCKVELYSEEGILENAQDEWVQEVFMPALEKAQSLKKFQIKSNPISASPSQLFNQSTVLRSESVKSVTSSLEGLSISSKT